MAYELPMLPYDYAALEPHIDARTMEIHHTKHHNTYVTKANAALEKCPEFETKTPEELLKEIDSVPEEVRQALINNAGGHANHSLFWEIMGPNGGGEPMGALAEEIKAAFDSFTNFQQQFKTAGLNRFGSGWAWLCVAGDGSLQVGSTPNQDSPLMQGLTPILGCDVWEHAYYLKYQNRRPDYLDAWWNVVNWGKVAELYEAAKS